MNLKEKLNRYGISENDLKIGYTNFKNKYSEKFSEFPFISRTTYQNLKKHYDLENGTKITRKYRDLRKKHYYSELNENDFRYVFSIDAYDFNNTYSVVRLAILNKPRKNSVNFKYDNKIIFEVFKLKTKKNGAYYHHSESLDDIYRLVQKAKKHLKLENDDFMVFSDNSKAFESFRKLYDDSYNCKFSSNKQHILKLEQIHSTLRKRFIDINQFDDYEKIENHLNSLNNPNYQNIVMKFKKIPKNLKEYC